MIDLPVFLFTPWRSAESAPNGPRWDTLSPRLAGGGGGTDRKRSHEETALARAPVSGVALGVHRGAGGAEEGGFRFRFRFRFRRGSPVPCEPVPAEEHPPLR